MNPTSQVSMDWMAAPISLMPVQWTWDKDAFLKYTEARGIFVSAPAKKIGRSSLGVLQDKANTSCISFPSRKISIQKNKYQTNKTQSSWNTSQHFFSYYGFFSKLDSAHGIKTVSEQLSAIQTINLKVRKAIAHSNGLLGAPCWTLPQRLKCYVIEHHFYKSYAMSCFFKIPEKAIPKKINYSHGEEYRQIDVSGEPKQATSHLSHHYI